jgi:single-stranded DNA-binding protein
VKLISTNLKISFASLYKSEIIYPLGVNLMQVTLSGRTGCNVETNQVDRLDGTGSFPIAETSLAVNVAKDSDPDWHKLKFVGDALTKAAAFIPKGAAISVVGTLTFEHWNDDNGILRSKSVVTISEVQLPSRTPVAA